MTALAADKARNRYGEPIALNRLPMAASTTIYAGSLVVANAAGYAAAATTATGLFVRGVCNDGKVNSGAAGAENVGCLEGDFEFENSSAGDAIAQANVGDTVYIVDDNTVALTDGTGTRSAAGKLVCMSPNGKPVVRVVSAIL